MDYSVLIIGYDKDWKNANSSVEQLFLNLKESFLKLESVKTTALHFDSKELPKVDFVIAIIFSNTIFDFDIVKVKTEAKKVTSFIEVPFSKADHSFVFTPNNNCTLIKFPYADFLETKSKKRSTILIDHYWEDFLGTENDWTYRIEDWLESVKNEYEIKRLIRFSNEVIREFEAPIVITGYKDYLNKTNDIENFIVTHRESFGYGIIDMIVRGTRVLSPPNLLSDFMVNELGIQIFNNKQELLELVSLPVDSSWKDKRKYCTNYTDIVKIIDKKFRMWLRE